MIDRDDFGQGGAALWDELHLEIDPIETTVLIQEACRISDRLDHLASAVDNGGVFDLVEVEDAVITVRVDSALAEARQQANALRLLLNDIAKRRAAVPGDDEPDGLDDL